MPLICPASVDMGTSCLLVSRLPLAGLPEQSVVSVLQGLFPLSAAVDTSGQDVPKEAGCTHVVTRARWCCPDAGTPFMQDLGAHLCLWPGRVMHRVQQVQQAVR